MIQPITIFFVIFSALFALVHWFAVGGSLYWYYWWFDIVMHFWGGLLIALGVVSLASFRRFTFVHTYKITLLTTLFVVTVWELFEWQTRLIDPVLEWHDTLYDVAIGMIGALVGYYVVKRLKF